MFTDRARFDSLFLVPSADANYYYFFPFFLSFVPFPSPVCAGKTTLTAAITKCMADIGLANFKGYGEIGWASRNW